MSVSEKRKAASRANGAKSHGPVSEKGKVVSSRNSLRHGQLSRSVVLDSESSERFSELVAALIRDFRPSNETERMLVETMAVARWRQMRVWTMEKASLTWEIRKQCTDHPEIDTEDESTKAALAFRRMASEAHSIDLLSRYEARFDRQYNRALQRLMQMKTVFGQTNPASA